MWFDFEPPFSEFGEKPLPPSYNCPPTIKQCRVCRKQQCENICRNPNANWYVKASVTVCGSQIQERVIAINYVNTLQLHHKSLAIVC